MPTEEAVPGVNPATVPGKQITQAVAGVNPLTVTPMRVDVPESEKYEARFGCLGEILFTVSEKLIRNIENIKWSGSAKYQAHQRAAGNSLVEFVGIEPDKMSFDMHFSSLYGVDPMEEITKLWTYERNHSAIPLTFGLHPYGRWRWVITGHSIKVTFTDIMGRLTDATISVELEEYLHS